MVAGLHQVPRCRPGEPNIRSQNAQILDSPISDPLITHCIYLCDDVAVLVFTGSGYISTKLRRNGPTSDFHGSPYQPAIDAAKRMIFQHMKSLDVPGMQMAVYSKGRLICSESFGFSDLEKRRPVTHETSFRIGSVSKSLTAAALGRLVQQKLIDLEDPVTKYVPLFPKKPWPITVRQLAEHTSGIRHYATAAEADSSKHYESVKDSLEIFKNDPLLFEPGTSFGYSSYGYVLLSAVIEAASKMTFPDLMNDEVFSPIGLKHTSMDYADKEIPHRSKFYVLDDRDKRVVAPFVDHSSKWASGGMVSTAEDLVRFGDAMLRGQFLNTEVTKALFTSGKTRDGKETGFGLGWEIMRDAHDRRVFVNDGSLPSARAFLAIYPEDELVIAVLANTGKNIFFNREEGLMLADLFLNPKGLSPSSEERKMAIGEYSYTTLFDDENIVGKITVFEQDGGLRGTMSIPNSFFKDRVVAVPVVRVSGKSVTILGTPWQLDEPDFRK